MSTFPAILDANVLVPNALRDTLLLAAEAGLYRPHWSREILAEVRRVLVRIPRLHITPERADRMIAQMEAAFDDARVDGYERLVDAMTNDPKDRHVMAAAVRIGAQVIVTRNLKDFPPVALSEFGIEAQHPDAFLTRLFDLNPDAMVRAVEQQAAQLKRPPIPIDQVLCNVGLLAPGFAERVRVRRQEHA